MKTVAVVVEYNPFHNGHLWHLQESRKITGADVVVAIMSGNFLQRGEPALADKWTRAHMCLRAGVDVVFELPAIFATSSAEQFAWGAINIFEQFNTIDNLCFGSEVGDIAKIKETAAVLISEPGAYKETLKENLRAGHSYAKSVSSALTKTINNKEYIDIYSKPNNLLGLMYLAALNKNNSNIIPHTIKRKSADYHQIDIIDNKIASATAIRKLINKNQISSAHNYIPENSMEILQDNYIEPVTLEMFRDIIFATILTHDVNSLQTINGINEALAYSIINNIKNNNNLANFLSNLTTKNYTATRINRAIISILLNIKSIDCIRFQNPTYVKILGFNKIGQEFLKLTKKKTNIEIISKWANIKNKHSLYDERATAIYSICEKRVRRQNYTFSELMKRDYSYSPIIVK